MAGISRNGGFRVLQCLSTVQVPKARCDGPPEESELQSGSPKRAREIPDGCEKEKKICCLSQKDFF